VQDNPDAHVYSVFTPPFLPTAMRIEEREIPEPPSCKLTSIVLSDTGTPVSPDVGDRLET
jgi:hypothetical protein